MKGVSSAPGDFVHFKSLVPLHQIPIGSKHWRYYDFGPKAVPPLVCIPGIAGTADVYYKQIMSLSMKGYRVISVDIPRVWNHHEWIHAFEKFLDTMNIHHVHIYGTSLGGFLAQIFAQHRPRRGDFDEDLKVQATLAFCLCTMPNHLIPPFQSIHVGIRDGPHEPFIADSVDFVVGQVETLSREDLSSRLTLNASVASVGPLLLSDSFITIMDTNDYSAVPQQLKDQLSERYPGARRAVLKTGGDFPFLSRPDEVNLYLQLHLRRVGVEAKPDLVQGFSKGGSAGSSNDEKKGQDRFENPPGSGDHEDPGPHNRGHEPQSLGSETNDSDDQILSLAMVDAVNLEIITSSMWLICFLLILQYYMATLYITQKALLAV
ncbi:uncharacterized protein [Typha latifolia]|uniref:uncharacterized protein isoform X2 n=1 Tax=Typha latifolia TaxID=4733 RepID=UPI003C30DE18